MDQTQQDRWRRQSHCCGGQKEETPNDQRHHYRFGPRSPCCPPGLSCHQQQDAKRGQTRKPVVRQQTGVLGVRRRREAASQSLHSRGHSRPGAQDGPFQPNLQIFFCNLVATGQAGVPKPCDKRSSGVGVEDGQGGAGGRTEKDDDEKDPSRAALPLHQIGRAGTEGSA